MPAPNPLLQEYLSQLAARGVTHVGLTDEARAVLATVQGARQQQVTPPATAGRTATPGIASSSPPSSFRTPQPADTPSAPRPSPAGTPLHPTQPVSPGSSASPARSKRELLDELAREAEGGKQARELGTLRDIMVFAVGNPDSDIMFIGEAPGAEEEKQREPFVGPAGQLLTKIIQAMGLRRSEVYISNVCKFRPKIDDGRMQGSKNRAPTTGEMLACQPYIMAEINIIKPRVIVCLGATASTGLGIEGTVGRLRGRVQEWRGHPLVVTYHPSYLLRREAEDGGGLAEKRLVWEDMMRVMEIVGLPISDKQRAYFSRAR
ncbi:DNA polymerase [Roseimicrobium gellanilyticum]|uniref:Type-4 uracil-DNA glycosylase n=1 Tax=Roseimicrobium gellanilyticum TaxID=748857 RepID=A0A366HQ21_9BACT|nr:uracil-DNA glycosylase [Roseimicrobium gellanilyticum]RBP45742.1 DNA polymerase [Roseimicrobium gellanilyticum]